MSGLAGYLRQIGYTVTGSDWTKSHKTEHLEEQGIPVAIGHDAANVRGADVIVYSAAIGADNPERREAERLGIPQIERCDLIGQLMEGHPFAVGVSGTHGKTTTTSMMAQAFLQAGNTTVSSRAECASYMRAKPVIAFAIAAAWPVAMVPALV